MVSYPVKCSLLFFPVFFCFLLCSYVFCIFPGIYAIESAAEQALFVRVKDVHGRRYACAGVLLRMRISTCVAYEHLSFTNL